MQCASTRLPTFPSLTDSTFVVFSERGLYTTTVGSLLHSKWSTSSHSESDVSEYKKIKLKLSLSFSIVCFTGAQCWHQGDPISSMIGVLNALDFEM